MQVFDDVEQRVETAAGLDDSLPAGEEAGEGALFDRFDLFSEAGQGFSAYGAEGFVVAPLAMRAHRGGSRLRRCGRFWTRRLRIASAVGNARPKRAATSTVCERSVGAAEAADEVDAGVGCGFEQGGQRQARPAAGRRARRGSGGGVFDGDEAFLAGDRDFEDAAGFAEPLDRERDFRAWCSGRATRRG